MKEGFTEFFGKNRSGIRKLLRSTRAAAATRVATNGGDRSATAPHGGELIVLAVPIEMRDLLYAQLLELRDLTRDIRAESKQVRFAGWDLDLLERRLVAPGGDQTAARN